MGIIQDRRPRDWTYLVAFDKKDFPLLMDIIFLIHQTHDIDMIEYINNQFENRSQSITIGNKIIELKSINKTEDLVTNMGLQQVIRIIQGTSTKRFSHMMFNNETNPPPPSVTDIQLTNYIPGWNFVPISGYGWAESKGMKLFYAVIIPQTQTEAVNQIGLSSFSINEMGIFNGTASGDDLLNHEVFYSNPVTREPVPDLSILDKIIIASCVIEFCPVA